MTNAKTGQTVRLTVDNWLGLVGLMAILIGGIVWQTSETAKIAAMVEQHEGRLARVEDRLDGRRNQ